MKHACGGHGCACSTGSCGCGASCGCNEMSCGCEDHGSQKVGSKKVKKLYKLKLTFNIKRWYEFFLINMILLQLEALL